MDDTIPNRQTKALNYIVVAGLGVGKLLKSAAATARVGAIDSSPAIGSHLAAELKRKAAGREPPQLTVFLREYCHKKVF